MAICWQGRGVSPPRLNGIALDSAEMTIISGGVSEQSQMVGLKNTLRRFAPLPGGLVLASDSSRRAARRRRLRNHFTALVGIQVGAVLVEVRAGTGVLVAVGLPQRAATRARARLTTRCSRRGPRSRSGNGRPRGVARAAERER